MDHTNSVLLPCILESLCQKPKLCDTYENLCEDINDVLSSENLKRRYGTVQKAIENALDVGQSLGVITLTDDLVRVPFKMSAQKAALAPTNESESFVMQPRRTRTVPPNMIPHGRSRRRVSRARRRRRGSRRSRSRRR